MTSIVIDGVNIGVNYPPYIVAELSANHNGSIENAFKLIEVAKKSGASAVKLQTYSADTITLNSDSDDFLIEGGLWKGKKLYDLYKEAEMPWEWHEALFKYAKEIGITIFSSPFDNTAIDLLEDLNAPAYKIASFEAVDLPLIRYAASTGKPLIISTGMADLKEIQGAIDAATDGGCKELAILHCVSGYPAPAKDYNLRTIADMHKRFSFVTGLSDHTIDNTTAITSVALGASIVEKHITLDRKGGGVDDSFSLEPKELKKLCKGCLTAWEALGKVDYSVKPSEAQNIKFRRSLYFVKDMKTGETITNESVKSVRPGYGINPNDIDKIIGKMVNKNINKYTAVSNEDIAF